MKNYLLLFTYFIFTSITIAQDSKKIIVIDSTIKQNELRNLNKALTDNLKDSKKIILSKGYFNYKILKIDTLNNITRLHTYLGTKKNTITLSLPNTNKIPLDIQKLTKNIQKVLSIDATEAYLNDLSKEITDLGYSFNTVTLKDIHKEDSNNYSAKLWIEISDKKRNVSNIIIKGYSKFPKMYLKRFLNIKTGQTLNIDELKKKSKRTTNLSFVEEIKSPEILFTKDSTTLYMYLKKVNANNFDGFIGFNSKEDSKSLEFTGYLNLNLINNLNYGERFTIIYKSDESEQKNFQAELELPYLFNTPIGLETSLRIFNRDSSFTNTTTEIKGTYNTKNNLKYKIGYQTLKSNTTNTLITENTEDFESNFITTAIEYLKNDNKSRTNITKSALKLNLLLGNRKNNDQLTKQTKLYTEVKNRFYLNNKNAIELKISGSTILSDNLLTNELIRTGGINSIRGFAENSIETSLYAITNIEYHYLLNKGLGINSVTDFGYIENDLKKQKLYSLGLGLTAITKAGLLKLTFANGTTDETKLKFRNSQLHLSLIAFF